MNKCLIHNDKCFLPPEVTNTYAKLMNLQAHIAVDELTKDWESDPTGPETAIARVHTLRKQGRYKEADALKEKFHISVYPDGYAAFQSTELDGRKGKERDGR